MAMQEVLDALLAGLPSALPAAKRHRLRCLRCVIVLLQYPGAPAVQTQLPEQVAEQAVPVDGVQQVRLGHSMLSRTRLTVRCVAVTVIRGCKLCVPSWGSVAVLVLHGCSPGQARYITHAKVKGQVCSQVVSALVGEIVLCTKEVNKKTRAAAFALLVDLAAAMHEAMPIPQAAGPADSAMGEPAVWGTDVLSCRALRHYCCCCCRPEPGLMYRSVITASACVSDGTALSAACRIDFWETTIDF